MANGKQITQPAQITQVDDAAEKKARERKAEVSKISADLMTTPSFCNALTSSEFINGAIKQFGDVSMMDLAGEVKEQVAKVVVEGDMAYPEAILISQAMSLSSVYNRCAELAGVNIINKLPQAEVLMRMALKAQSQCTQTLRVLGELKNPKSVAFIKQQNNAHQQQVNNGTAPPTVARVHEEKPNQSNELLTDNRDEQHGATLDTGATSAAGRAHQTVEAVGAVDRADDRRG
ncbi:hypothetical protein OKW45_005686 [Paraburkholderia sp. WSM4175]|uniref:hypothetical protein n=1 Tax=Paraburkholderia sp. WSM4175 TaxID=2991072 RepID=UPI003D1AE66E